MMDTILQGLVLLSSLFLAGLGIRTVFVPKSMVEVLDIGIETAAGLNTVRGFLGGLFIGSSVILVTGLVTGNTTFFLAVAMTMSAVVFGRWVGIAGDGFDRKIGFPLVMEMIMVTIFVVAYTYLGV
ncbi:hypothetical protein L4C34_15060 [Vibrio profundum]|uniref:DUF4345 family protein n=1 Tax=Vibrio profundum TaxID=2910247 RepID=UPI003D1152E7